MNRRKVSILLMVLTIGAIVLFQVSWLKKNYEEEKRVFTIHTNLLFRETLFKLQVARLHLDTSLNLRIEDKAGLITMTNVLKEKVTRLGTSVGDTGPLQGTKAFVLSLRHDSTPANTDSLQGVLYKSANARIFQFLKGVDSLQDSITVKEVADRYKEVLAREGVNIPFRVTVTQAKIGSLRRNLSSDPGGSLPSDPGSPRPVDPEAPSDTVMNTLSRRFSRTTLVLSGRATPDSASDKTVRSVALEVPGSGNFPKGVFRTDNDDNNKVTMGFSRPRVYELNFDNSFWLMARRIGPQALISFFLVGFTVFSFLLLYRNWQQQRRLTELKNDFINNMTHELKTPIATVSVAVEALKNFNALQDPVRTQEYLDISAGELQRLSLLVDKVLKLSLFETQEIELKNDYFDLKALAEEVMASMRLQFEKQDAWAVIGTRGSDFFLRADKLHITSVIFNLLDNALKYSDGRPSIQVELVEDAEQLLLSVTDNGIGIPAAYKEKIFEKFFRVPTGDKHNVKGYGLGLSYVSYVLQRQGGRISVESQPGAGSRFTIQIPRNHTPFTPTPAHV